MEIRPIAHIFTDFPEKFGIPRQSGLAGTLRGRIVFEKGFRNSDALRGLEGFSHLWLVWEFSANPQNGTWQPTVHLPADDPRFRALESIGSNYPPAHITTACHDFLRGCAQPMYDFLTEKGIPCRLDCYGTEEDKSIAHVFHINIITEEAIRCNDTQCDFFRQYL